MSESAFSSDRSTLSSQLSAGGEAAFASAMDAFYRALAEGRDAAAAHREATLYVRAQWPHPYHWAGFFLTGRPPIAASAAPIPAAIDATDVGEVLEARAARVGDSR